MNLNFTYLCFVLLHLSFHQKRFPWESEQATKSDKQLTLRNASFKSIPGVKEIVLVNISFCLSILSVAASSSSSSSSS